MGNPRLAARISMFAPLPTSTKISLRRFEAFGRVSVVSSDSKRGSEQQLPTPHQRMRKACTIFEKAQKQQKGTSKKYDRDPFDASPRVIFLANEPMCRAKPTLLPAASCLRETATNVSAKRCQTLTPRTKGYTPKA